MVKNTEKWSSKNKLTSKDDIWGGVPQQIPRWQTFLSNLLKSTVGAASHGRNILGASCSSLEKHVKPEKVGHCSSTTTQYYSNYIPVHIIHIKLVMR